LAAADAARQGISEGDLVRVESPRGRIEVRARITAIVAGTVFAPFHYGYFDTDKGEPDSRPRAANELTLTEWDPVSKQPNYKVCAVRVTKLADGNGEPAPAPTTAASAPVGDFPAGAAGGSDARAASTDEEA
jgi:ferredoxin-nitrate reductase